MKSLRKLLYIIPLTGMMVTSCMDVENIEIDHIGGYATMNNAESEAYYANLRAYKATAWNYNRPVAFGWYSNWAPAGAYRRGYLSAMPDSMDFVSMWSGAPGRYEITPEQKADKEFVQKVKGTKLLQVSLLSYLGKGATPNSVYLEVEKQAEEEGWSAQLETAKKQARWKYWGFEGQFESENHYACLAKFAKALCDSLYANEWDGYDVDWEIGSGVFDMDGTLSQNKHLIHLVKEMNNYIGPKSDPEGKGHKMICIDGNIYGLPMYGFNEFVYYRKSIFNELGLEVPTTWEDFNSVTQKLKASGEYIPMALGGKDSWVTYPFNEFFPFLVSGGNDVWSKMAAEDEPFSPGKPFYTAYSMLNEFYKTKPFGDDPLGYGWDQEKNMFVSKKAAMLAAGQWFYMDLAKDLSKEDLEDIGVFVIPTRKTKDENFRYLVTAEVFLAIPKYSKHQEEAKEFINWLFTSDYYKEFIKYMQVLPTVDGVEISGDIFSEAVNSIPNPEPVLQKGGNDAYRQISNFISFDVKRMGQEMLQGVDFEKYMAEYNQKWKEARKNIN